MVEVTIIAPDHPPKQAEIDPAASLERIKNDIVRGLKIGNPDEFDIFIAPNSKKEALQNYVPSSGDTILLIKPETTGRSTVRFKD
ncbi:hypothetical protein JW887_04065 [Candidatus Dojkabacteria bacterium]|nr:hypothetical protein [Candidatus Dojkabacteria bacterium]